MKLLRRTPRNAGFTLIEIAIVISIIVLLALGVSQSATYFRTQANTSLCIVNQKQIQDAMRSVANIQNIAVGQPFASGLIIGKGLYFEISPTCPTTTTAYTYQGTVPDPGADNNVYATCTTPANQGGPHTPPNHAGW